MVSEKGSDKRWIMTGVYGRKNPKERRRLWRRELERMASNFYEPWIVAGDSNAVSSSEDKLGGLRPPRVPTLKFRTMISDFHFMELHKGKRNLPTLLLSWYNPLLAEPLCLHLREIDQMRKTF
ncbi:unnamed protein product [Coffea canephora]|uniref:Endonuclease/exonuclease/phosphatase domain-containing protein n=1 Tax=Coffea canephora TaxID=49390 RepID=A0A068USU3_COFCA|nr:unnamed protein product [Coffea canephora]